MSGGWLWRLPGDDALGGQFGQRRGQVAAVEAGGVEPLGDDLRVAIGYRPGMPADASMGTAS
jgi:hypothetical protein